MEKENVKFSKTQFLESEKFRKYCDVISVILDDEEMYSVEDVEKKIKKFLEGRVN